VPERGRSNPEFVLWLDPLGAAHDRDDGEVVNQVGHEELQLASDRGMAPRITDFPAV
jgi:hypothetical protein